MRGVSLLALASVLVVAAVVGTRDPDEPWAVAALIVALGTFCGALVTMLQLRRRRARGRATRASPGIAARRGLEVAVSLALLLWLRAVDGLSVITAAFVLGAFIVAELIISARPGPSRSPRPFVEPAMRSCPLDRTFTLITIPFNTVLMLTPDARWACLARCREHLTPHGRLAIDVFQPDPNIIAGLDGGVREEWRRADPETGRVVTKFSSTRANVDAVTLHWWFDDVLPDGSVSRIGREATLHYLYRREAELLFPDAGFELDSLHGDYDGSVTVGSSPKLLCVLRRRERGAGRERRHR